MSGPCQQTMEDGGSAPVQRLQAVEEPEFGMLMGAGKGGGFELVMPSEETLPVIGKQDKQCCRIYCCCTQYGFMGDVMENLTIQYLCLRVKLKPEFKFDIVTGLPFVSDENFLQWKCLFFESGCTKFRPGCQYLCLKCVDLSDSAQVTPS